MGNTLSEAELKTLYKFMSTDLGKKVLGNIEDVRQDYLNAAVAGFMRGKDFTHDCVVAAAACDTIYTFLKPRKKAKKDE